MVITQEQTDALEALIDRTDLNQVLDALSAICREKAEHLRVNWQDQQSARVWREAARKIGHVVDYAHINAL